MALTPEETTRLAEIERDLLGRYPDLMHAFTVPAAPEPPRMRVTASCTIAPATVAWQVRRGPRQWLLEHGIPLGLAVVSVTALLMTMWVLAGTAGRA
jgi:hypothetical protein